MNYPKIGALYQHYKNHKHYRILCIARHTETNEHLVIYQAQYDDPDLGQKPIFARPVDMFMERVEYQGKVVPRFELIKS